MEQQTTIESFCRQLKTVSVFLMPSSCNTPEKNNLEEKTHAVSGIEVKPPHQNRRKKKFIYVGIFSSLC